MPPTAGSASTAAAALPPLRFRSSPQPQRTSAGDDVDVEIGEAPRASAGSIPASRGRALDRPRRRRRAQPVGAVRVRVEERRVGVSFLEHHAVQRERDRQIGAGPHGEVQVGLLRERRRARIDHDERRAARPALP